MFERTLQDLIRGLRAHKASSKAQEDAFLAEVMLEIKEEMKGKDMVLKAEGIIKMCYLLMLYPIPPPSGFAFHVVEVMSSQKYHLKQLAYLAAPMAFSGDTEEVVLTVNGIKKDLMSPHIAIPPLPLTALPHLLSLSPSLSSTLHPDLLHLLTHSSARIRKRAVLCLLPCWEAFPEGLREGFPRLRDKLQDEDQGVVGATVSVVMELARRQGGKNYLPLAPELFGILTGSSNNWMLIKVIKLFAILTPLEPRLVRKLLPPITNLISTTSAISLLYECVRTCIVGGMLDPDRPESDALARVCVEKLGGYLRDEGGDQNLRYIALLAMVKITPTHPHMVAEYSEEVLRSLDDPDVSIRMRALELITSMVDQENLQSIADQLLTHLSPPDPSSLPSAVASLQALTDPNSSAKDTASAVSLTPAYRLLLTQRLLGIISHNTYINVTDFGWVISILVDVSYVSKVNVGREVRDMLLDVVGRVRSVRAHAVMTLEKVLGDSELRERANERGCEEGLLEAAIWICGEYSIHLASALSTISALLPSSLPMATPAIISLSIGALIKMLGTHLAELSSRWSIEHQRVSRDLIASSQSGIEPFLTYPDVEVQERATELSTLLSIISSDFSSFKLSTTNGTASIPGMESGFAADHSDEPTYPKSLFLLQPLYSSHELNAVSIEAQAAVRPPEGLDLDRDIVPGGGWADVPDEPEEVESAKEDADLGEGGGEGMEELRRVIREQGGKKRKGKGKKREGEIGLGEEDEERARRRRERKQRQKDDPYYLGANDEVDVDEIPIVKLDISDLPPDNDNGATSSTKRTKAKSSKPRPKKAAPVDLDRTGEMPEGSSASALISQPSVPQVNGGTISADGLAGIDLLSSAASGGKTPSSRFDEYVVEEDTVVPATGAASLHEAVPEPQSSRQAAEESRQDEVPVGGDVEVVKVKRKKKKKAVE